MSAETLRRAAALMRERAEAATPGPWVIEDDEVEYNVLVDEAGPGAVYIARQFNQGFDEGLHDATHVASWHPAVALAVADLLDDTADALGSQLATGDDPEQDVLSLYGREIAVARAYLGEAAWTG